MAIAQAVNDYLELTKEDAASKSLLRICSLINEKLGSLMEVVECMSQVLTDVAVDRRLRGTQLLACVLHNFSPGILTEQEVQVVSQFLISRLADHHSIQPHVLYGILGLVSFQRVSETLIIDTCRAIFGEVHVQSLLQADRRNVYNLFANILENHLATIQKIGPEFLLGFIQAMDSERDPRNLVVCFRNANKIVRQMNFTVLAEDLFEVLACYFPIDFNAPNEPDFASTKDELVRELRYALSGSDKFAPFLMPLLLEKWTSDVDSAKIEAAATFVLGVQNYSACALDAFFEQVWLSIRRELLFMNQVDVRAAFLQVLNGLVVCLASSPDQGNLLKLVDMILKDASRSIKTRDMPTVLSCGAVLSTVINASQSTRLKILEAVIAEVFASFDDVESVKKQTEVIDLCNMLLPCSLQSSSSSFSGLIEFFRKVSSNCLKLLKNAEFDFLNKSSVIALLSTALMFLSDLKSDWSACTIEITRLVYSGLLKGDLRTSKEIRKLIETLRDFYADVSEVEILKPCFQNLNDEAPTRIPLSDISLSLFCTTVFSQSPKFADACWKVVMAFLFNLVGCSELAYTKEALQSLPKCLPLNCRENHSVASVLSVVYNLLNLPVANEKDSDVLQSFLVCLNSLIDTACEGARAASFEFASALFLRHDTRPLLDNLGEWIRADVGGCVGAWNIENSVVYLEAAVVSMRLEDMERLCADAVLTSLLAFAERASLDRLWLARHALEAYAVILNKSPAELVAATVPRILLDIGTGDSEKAYRCTVLAWTCKALFLRCHGASGAAFERLLSLLEGDSPAQATRCFSLLVSETGSLSRAKHANVRLLHVQSMCRLVIPKLLTLYERDTGGTSIPALCSMLRTMPKQLLERDLKKLMPILVQSLSFKDQDIIAAALITVKSVLQSVPTEAEPYVEAILGRLVDILKPTTESPRSALAPMAVRVGALACLKDLTKYPTYLIYPARSSVLQALKWCLNDRKRMVRSEAVSCSNAWHMLLSGAAD